MKNSKYKQELAAEYLDILDNYLTFGVSIIDPDMNYEFISRKTYDNLGITPEQLKAGDPLSRCHELMVANGLLTPDMIAQQRLSDEHQKQRAQTGRDMASNIVRLGNGTAHRFTRKALPDGRTVSISDDVTELVTVNEMLHQALALGNAGYWVYDIANKTYELSDTLQYYFSKEDQELIHSKGIIAIVHPDDRPAMREALKNISKTDDRFSVTCRSNTYKGNQRWSDTTGQIIRNAEGKPVKIRAFVQDITRDRRQSVELERAKDEAIAASKAKSEFLANMSHEIRTPMNGVLGMAELLAQTEINDRQREYINVITNSSQALLTIINDILDFSKIEAGAFQLDPTAFNLREAIDDVMSLVSSRAVEKNLELIVNYSPSLPRNFLGDPGRIRQVMINLLGNAIKFTQEGHVLLNVSVFQGKDGIANIRIEVKDTGIGIERDKIETVFQKFTQADNSTTRLYGGTGLGLSISRRIVELMNGKMWVESTFGQGSTFYFDMHLPIDTQARTGPRNADPVMGKRALIIDDIEVNRKILLERCASWKMQSCAVKDGIDAVTELERAIDAGHPYDIIISDYLMPGMNGQEMATVIAANNKIAGTPIIMLSSCDQPVSSQELSTIGITQYLVKPVREQRLLDALCQNILEVSQNVSEQKPEPEPSSLPTAKEPSAPSEAKTMATNIQQRDDIQSTLKEIEAVLDAVKTHSTTSVDEASDSQLIVPQPVSLEMSSNPIKASPRVSGRKISILVAEDFPLNQDVVRLMLQDTKYAPTFANNGQDAVREFKDDPDKYRAILMDISMPVMDGYEAAETIHAYQKLIGQEPIPIVALTGHALKHDREKCLDSSMCDYLTKPVKQEKLIATLDHWIMGTPMQQKRA